MNGPNPVCTSARKKMNQSRPRRLWREGVGFPSGTIRPGTNDKRFSPPLGPPGRLSSIRLDGRTARVLLRYLLERDDFSYRRPHLVVKLERLQAAGCTQNHDRLVFLVLGGGIDLF